MVSAIYYAVTGLDLVSDTPYNNDLIARDTVTLSTSGQDVSISLEATSVVITKISDVVTVYIQDVANVPPWYSAHTSDDITWPITAQAQFNKIILTGTGTCEVLQFRGVVK